ncbi:hypothetical protein QN277_028880 [Acacia crassicarpa]|uniref:Reverse transcriptase domain-containing protein n=1 Tax=Acacia crassicarpa TaxID=499986 RepID=A0AAE1J458_9FABA|nr:hypothetical protein QN277_028880 [Acacia crassicarpa]
MEKLTHLIVDCVNERRWKPLRMGRQGMDVSHLLFADDLLLVCQADMNQMSVVLETLEKFGVMFGQRVNVQKTSVFFSKNVERRVQNDICMLSGFKKMEDLGRYLGAFMTGGRDNKRRFQSVLDKMQGKLSSWKKTKRYHWLGGLP